MYFIILFVFRFVVLEMVLFCFECLEDGFGLRFGFVLCLGLGCIFGFVVGGIFERDLFGFGFSVGFDFIGLLLLLLCFDLDWFKNNLFKLF